MELWTEKQESSVILRKTRLLKLLNWIMVDRAVLFSILAKIWGLGTGPVTALLIAWHFTPEVQGYYYTFGNILALQVFVELGLGVVLVQFTSHEWSRLRFDPAGRIVGDEEALSRLISIARVGSKWYQAGGVLVALGLSLGGYLFFSASPSHGVSWFWAWLCLCGLAGLNICLVPVWSLLEGCNQVSQLYTFRFVQSLCYTLTIWMVIRSGGGLWTAPVALLVSLSCAAIFLWTRYRPFLTTLLLSHPSGPRISWSRDLLPMQWRIALSWASGYFVFSIFTPVLFWYHGPVVAGQMGMTWSLVNAMQIAVSWLAPRVPQFGILVAQRKYDELDRLLWRLTYIIVTIGVTAGFSIWLFVYVLYDYGFHLATRLLPPLPTALFLMAQLLMIFSMPFSVYMRAHKTEPIVHLSVIGGVLNGISAFTLGKYYGANGMALGYLLISVMIIPLVLLIWRRRRAEWRLANSS